MYFLGGAENYPFCKPMVDHNQKKVKARGYWQVSDKVAQDLLEGLRGERSDRSERWDGGVGVQLVLLAGGISFNILSDKLGETRPPEFSCDELASFKVTWVASSFMVMAVVDYGSLK